MKALRTFLTTLLILAFGTLGGLAGCATQNEVRYSVSNPPCDFARMTRSLDQFSTQHGLRSAQPYRKPLALGGFWAPNIRYVDASDAHIQLIAYDLTNGVDVALSEERRSHSAATPRFLELDSALQNYFQSEFGSAVNRSEAAASDGN